MFFDYAVTMDKNLAAWNVKRMEHKLLEIEHRFGNYYCPCVAGIIGGEQRADFAIIGDVEKFGNGICDASKEFDTNFQNSSDLEKKSAQV